MEQRVALAGLGAVGMDCARALDAGLPGLRLARASAADLERAARRVESFLCPPLIVAPERLAEETDIVVDCAPSSAFRGVAVPALEGGRTLLTISGAALLENWDMVDLARRSGGVIHLASGAVPGLDAVQAARRGRISRVRMVTTKPPPGLAGAPHLIEHGIEIENLDEPLRVFAGNAREGARAFPANVNVAAALGLAAGDPDLVELEVWADPSIRVNRHRILVESNSANIDLSIENIPSQENPRSGRIVALSVVACLEKMVAALRIGT